MSGEPRRGEKDQRLRALNGAASQKRLGHCAIGYDGEPDLPSPSEPMPSGLTWKQRLDVMASRVEKGLSPLHDADASCFDVSDGMPRNVDSYRRANEIVETKLCKYPWKNSGWLNQARNFNR